MSSFFASALGRSRRVRRVCVAIGLASVTSIALAAAGCSSDPVSTACDTSKCAEGNRCILADGETKCRKTCSSNADPAKSCPFDYTCVDRLDGTEPFCVADTATRAQDGKPLEKKPTGQWGFPCNAAGGLDANPDCDVDQQFYCFGIAPTDGDAYCTRYGCEKDRDCAAGFTCQDINVSPNVTTTKRTIGETQKVCVRRAFCSTCQVDLDCPEIGGRKQHCISGEDGATFCAPECEQSANCNYEALCGDQGAGYKICYPRAGKCVGDGSLCSPCRSDKDCGADGACVKGQYTTEYSCAKKAPQSCEAGKAQGGCVQSLTTPKVAVRCLGGAFEQVPADYCHGLFALGQSGDIGCWTPAR